MQGIDEESEKTTFEMERRYSTTPVINQKTKKKTQVKTMEFTKTIVS